MRTSLINYGLYQLGWCACVMGAGMGFPLAGTITGASMLAIHLALAEQRRNEMLLAAFAAVLGMAIDSLQIRLGTIHFPPASAGPSLHAALPPLWMLILWAQLATTLNYSMSWLRRGWLRACLFGAAGGPLAFWAGGRLDAVQLNQPLWATFILLGGLWSIAVPVLVVASSKLTAHYGPGGYRRVH